MSDFTRIRTCVLAIIRVIRGTPGKFRSMIHNWCLVNIQAYSMSIRSSSFCSASALSPPAGPVTTARPARVNASLACRLRIWGKPLPAVPAVPYRERLAFVSGIRVTVPSIAPTCSPPPTSIPAGPSSWLAPTTLTAASHWRFSCCSGAGPIAVRHLDSTVPDGTACSRRHGTASRSPNSVAITWRASAAGINTINRVARMVKAMLISRRAFALIFPVRRTPAATRSIASGPHAASSSTSPAPNRAWSHGRPSAWTRPSRRTVAGATTTTLQKATTSPDWIFPAASTTIADRPSVSEPSRPGHDNAEIGTATMIGPWSPPGNCTSGIALRDETG
jgi:hypothetical protein